MPSYDNDDAITTSTASAQIPLAIDAALLEARNSEQAKLSTAQRQKWLQ